MLRSRQRTVKSDTGALFKIESKPPKIYYVRLKPAANGDPKRIKLTEAHKHTRAAFRPARRVQQRIDPGM